MKAINANETLIQLKNPSPTQNGQNHQYSTELINAINAIFTLFRLNWENQYRAAYAGDDEKYVKKMWASKLEKYPASAIREAASEAVDKDQFLPNIARMKELIKGNRKALHQDYIEQKHDELSDEFIDEQIANLRAIMNGDD